MLTVDKTFYVQITSHLWNQKLHHVCNDYSDPTKLCRHIIKSQPIIEADSIWNASSTRQQVDKVFSMQDPVTKKRERQRLKELFLGVEPLVTNPAGNTQEIRREPENLPSHIADVEKPVTEYENSKVDIEATLDTNPQVIQQLSDGIVIEENQIEYAHSIDKLEIEPDLTVPLKAGGQTVRETEIPPQPDMQLRDEGLNMTLWQVVGVGTITGALVTGLVLALTFQMNFFDNLGRLVLAGGEILFGIFGTLVGKSSKNTWRAIWIASVEWALFPVIAALIFILLLALMTLTSFFGV
jgi:hypothetical protein